MAGKLNVADYLSRLPSTLTPAYPTQLNQCSSHIAGVLACADGLTIKTTRFADSISLPLVQYQLFCHRQVGIG